MRRDRLSPFRIGILAIALTAALFLSGTSGGAETPILFYFDDSTLSVQPRTINGVTYVPLRDIVNRMALPYSEVFATETYTLRGPGGQQAVLTRDARSISIDGRVTQLSSPILRESGEWLAPLDFLELGLGRVAGIEVRHRADAHRVFAGRTKPPELTISSQDQGTITRVTVRAEAPIRLEMRRERGRVSFGVDRIVDPLRERLEVRSRLVTAITFEDAEGKGRIFIETPETALEIRVTASEENRVHSIEFTRPPEIRPVPAPGPAPIAPLPPQISTSPVLAPGLAGLGPLEARPPAAPAPPPRKRLIKTIVLDPGHGGLDTGAMSGEVQEKALTLALARKIRPVLESRLGSTVLLTRDADTDVSNEARSVLANNNQANLLVSLHVGQSPNKLDFGGIYVMKDGFGTGPIPAPGAKAATDRLFVPWYLGYRASVQGSQSMARILRDELEQAIPAWRFPVRQAPLAVLASSAAPAIVVEIGNLSDPVNAMTLVDPVFQNKVVAATAAAIERYAVLTQPGAF